MNSSDLATNFLSSSTSSQCGAGQQRLFLSLLTLFTWSFCYCSICILFFSHLLKLCCLSILVCIERCSLLSCLLKPYSYILEIQPVLSMPYVFISSSLFTYWTYSPHMDTPMLSPVVWPVNIIAIFLYNLKVMFPK